MESCEKNQECEWQRPKQMFQDEGSGSQANGLLLPFLVPASLPPIPTTRLNLLQSSSQARGSSVHASISCSALSSRYSHTAPYCPNRQLVLSNDSLNKWNNITMTIGKKEENA